MRNHYVRWLSLLAFLSFVQLALAQSDDCTGAISITPGITSGTTAGATTDTGTPFCGTGVTSPGVWYQFVGNGGTAALDICGGGTWDSKLSAYTGTCGALVCETGNDDNFGVCGSSRSAIEFPTTNGVTYYVLVHGFGGANGPFDLNLSFGPPPPPPPANDDCSGAIAITPGTYSGSTSTATTDGTPFCGTSNTAPGVWYSFTGNGGNATITTCELGTNFDTKIHVYEGTCGSFSCVTGDDDESCPFGFGRSEVNFSTSVGATYLVLISGFGSNTGDFEFTLDLVLPPANDNCSGAEALDISAGTRTATGSTSGAAADGAPFCGTTNSAPGVWYEFTGNGNYVIINTCTNTSYDSKLSIYSGSCGGLVCETGNDDACGLQSQVELLTVAGTQYYLLVHGFGSNSGDFELSIEAIVPIPPSNDDCTNAETVVDGDVKTGSTLFAADESGNPGVGGCAGVPYNGSGGVWFSYTGDGSPVTVASCGSDYATKLTVYQPFLGNCTVLLCVTAADDNCGDDARVSFATGVGVEYLILLHGDNANDRGDYELTVTKGASNDDCADALPITCGSTVVGSTIGSTPDAAPGCNTSYDSNSGGVWYKYTSTGDRVTASLCGSNYDTKIHVYTGSCGFAAFNCVTSNDDACGLQSEVEFCTNAGEDYFILVSGFNTSQGSYSLSLNCSSVPPPANDECANAIPVAIGSTTPGTTVDACPDDNGTCGTTSNGTGAVWYSFVGEGDWMNVTTCNAVGFDTRLQIFTGTCGALVCEDGNDDDFGGCTFSGLRSKVIFFANEGVTYYVKVFGFNSDNDFELTVDLAPEVNILQEYDLNNPSFVVILNGVPGPSDFVPISQHNNVNSLLLVRYPGGAGQITGTLAPRSTQLARWDVNIQLRDRKNWTDWNAGGGLYKGSGPVAAANHQTWSFSEIAPGSYLSGHPGTGYAGDTLWLAHTPANMLYGMQRGLGANDFNGNFGISGWFTFSGAYSGTGDVNATITNVEACENSGVNCSPAPVSPMIVALEGASEGNNMRTTLSSNGVLSQTQPFNNSVYNYSGTESFTGTATNAVDWVLVSLRDPSNPRNVLARRAALVGQDGTLMNGDGSTFNLRDVGTVGQQYYIAVSSNNHLDVMTSDAVSITGGIDLTKGGNMIYNDASNPSQAFTKLPNGKIALTAGDANGDGIIDASDISNIQSHFHEAGAKVQDVDYDGIVTPQDLRKMMKNQGATSHVPR